MACASPLRSAARLGAATRLSSRRHVCRGPVAASAEDGAPSRRALLAGGGSALLFGARPALAARAGPRLDADRLLSDINWPADPPFDAEDFRRFDESDDAFFYDSPRFVTHIDDAAIGAYTDFLASDIFPPSGSGAAILDVCSSWISHYPKGYAAGRIAGLGMNEAELARNSVLTEYAVQDLNKRPKLPYPDDTFDVITNCVSVDYLSRPAEVFAEMHRVLKPGGVSVCGFSNRLFPTKAVSVWTSTGDEDHIRIVAAYHHFYPGNGAWEPAKGRDITRRPFIGPAGDPMYVVWARKKAQ